MAEAERLRALTVGAVEAVLAGIPEEKHGQVMESLELVRGAMNDAHEALRRCCG